MVEAGEARYAIEATSVIEVAAASAPSRNLRGVLDLQDLSLLLGGDAEPGNSLLLLLDVSPTVALRVRSVEEVADVARVPFFLMPPGVSDRLAGVCRGALLHKGKLYLELRVEALANCESRSVKVPTRPAYFVESLPDRALVFESSERFFGLPLSWVSQVVSTLDGFCLLPGQGGEVVGLLPHAQVLWPICSAPGILGEQAPAEALVILSELAGQNMGLSASRVLGVHSQFEATDVPGAFRAPGLAKPVLFLDLQRMFS